jgi:hypothetical protein
MSNHIQRVDAMAQFGEQHEEAPPKRRRVSRVRTVVDAESLEVLGPEVRSIRFQTAVWDGPELVLYAEGADASWFPASLGVERLCGVGPSSFGKPAGPREPEALPGGAPC